MVYMYVRVHVQCTCMYMCMYMYVYVCTCVCTCMYLLSGIAQFIVEHNYEEGSDNGLVSDGEAPLFLHATNEDE